MYSMKRSSARVDFAYSRSSTNSSSFTPRITTVSSLSAECDGRLLSDSAKRRRAASMPSRTAARPSNRVSCRNRSARSVSMLTVRRFNPASFSASTWLGQQNAVRGEREILQPLLRGEESNERGEIAPEQRFAAGQPNLVDAERNEHVDQRADFFEVEDVLARQPGVLVFRHAVFAAQVAAVGDRQAQVSQRTVQDVEHWIGNRRNHSPRVQGVNEQRVVSRCHGSVLLLHLDLYAVPRIRWSDCPHKCLLVWRAARRSGLCIVVPGARGDYNR